MSVGTRGKPGAEKEGTPNSPGALATGSPQGNRRKLVRGPARRIRIACKVSEKLLREEPLKLFVEFRNDLEEVTHDAIVGFRKYRSLRVLVNCHDDLG